MIANTTDQTHRNGHGSQREQPCFPWRVLKGTLSLSVQWLYWEQPLCVAATARDKEPRSMRASLQCVTLTFMWLLPPTLELHLIYSTTERNSEQGNWRTSILMAVHQFDYLGSLMRWAPNVWKLQVQTPRLQLDPRGYLRLQRQLQQYRLGGETCFGDKNYYRNWSHRAAQETGRYYRSSTALLGDMNNDFFQKGKKK